MKRTIKDGTSGHCSKPEDYHSNTPHLEITRNPPKQESPIVCVGGIEHLHALRALFTSQMPVHIERRMPAMPSGGPSGKSDFWAVNMELPRGLLKTDVFHQLTYGERMLHRHAGKSYKSTDLTSFRYEGNGGLSVSGWIVWCMLYGSYTSKKQSQRLLPTQAYLREVFFCAINNNEYPRPKPDVFDEVDYVNSLPKKPPFNKDNNCEWLIENLKQKLKAPKSYGLRMPRRGVSKMTHAVDDRPYLYELPTNPFGPHVGFFSLFDENGKLLKNKDLFTPQDDPIAYAAAVENGFAGTYNEWQWTELDK